MEAIARFTFRATQADEMSFEKGKVLRIIEQERDHWSMAELDGKSGLVPSNYLDLKEASWFHGKLSRSDAESLLMQQTQKGAFLIRESESTPGDFSLSVMDGHSVQHFKVLRDGAGKYFLWVVKFHSLNALVEYHRTSSVSRSSTIILKDMIVNFSVVAKHDFVAEENGELSFKRGDVITVTAREDPNWWTGTVDGREGIFPKTYVDCDNN